MFLKKNIFVLIFLFSNVIALAAFASGGEDNEDTSGGTFGGDGFGDTPQRVVDPVYESGKAIYKGRKKTVPKLEYCLRVDSETVSIKRKTIKQFKASSFSELAKTLYRCDAPDQSIKSELERTDFLHVLYYLDKRYKLNLERT